MTALALVQMLNRFAKMHRKRIFLLREIAALAGESRAAVGMSLLRAEAKGLVFRVGRYWVNHMDPPTLTDIAFVLRSPSYVSFESALYHHGILTQSPRGGLTLASSGRPQRWQTPLGTIEAIHLQTPLFFGFSKVRIADPEKAFLDLIYIRSRKGFRPLIAEDLDLALLNPKKLKSYTTHFPSSVKKLSKQM